GVPAGWHAEPERRTYHLAPAAYEVFPVTVTPPADAEPGRWFVAVRLRDEQGQVHEDVVTVDLGPTEPQPDAGHRRVLFLERATRKAAVVDEPVDHATVAAFGGEVTAAVLQPEVRVEPGEQATLGVRLTNHVAGAVRGEAQLV